MSMSSHLDGPAELRKRFRFEVDARGERVAIRDEDLPEAPDDGEDGRPPEIPETAEPWPQLQPAALHGLAGDVVRAIEPHTEADPAAVLVNLLVMFGNCAGPTPHVNVGAEPHRPNLFAAVVGNTSRGRKGTSLAYVRKMLATVEPRWARDRIMGGLSTGEGLINEVRDPREPKGDEEPEPPKDRRLLIIETEFGRSLRAMRREANTLSPILRQAWDSGDLAVLTRNDKLRATSAHISILSHVTDTELLRLLDDSDSFSGFSNRFLWVCARKSKKLPRGGSLPESEIRQLAQRIGRAIEKAHSTFEVRFDAQALELWDPQLYDELTREYPGLYGAVTSRAEAQVLRLSLVYALLDGSTLIRIEHLRAAAAVWWYAADSARYIFGQRTGDPLADRILEGLLEAPEGLNRTAIFSLLGNHAKAREIESALDLLRRFGLACPEKGTPTAAGGRPPEIWRARHAG